MIVANDVTIVLGGDAGQGMESSGAGLAKALTRDGFHVFAGPDYHSRIRGGHNFYTVRVAPRPISAHRKPVHLLLALTKDTVDAHVSEMEQGGAIVFDPELEVDEVDLRRCGLKPVPVPAAKLAAEAGDPRLANSVLLGAGAVALGWNLAALERVLAESFGKKRAALADANVKALRSGAAAAKPQVAGFPWRLVAGPAADRLFVGGSQAVCLGAVAAGCRFVAGYPMTPTTPILEWWAAHAPTLGLVMKEAEDEIAAVNMAIGAAFAGVRAMTATAGGGFSLMVEGLGLAGMVEVPVVIIEGQRAGPSTAMATRTEQGDLLSLLHASQGEFLRFVLTPGSVRQCFEATWRAFNLAERYQTPAIVVIDQYVAHFMRSLDRSELDLNGVVIDRGALLSPAQVARRKKPYRRYELTESGISPRALPGQAGSVYAATSDEHTPDSHISEESSDRVAMHTKRLAKMKGARTEMLPPMRFGPDVAPLALVCWGSTLGPAREAVEEMNAAGNPARLVHFCDMWPFPAEAAVAALKGARRIVSVEGNATGQFAWLLRAETGIKVDALVSRTDGRPFTVEDVVSGVAGS